MNSFLLLTLAYFVSGGSICLTKYSSLTWTYLSEDKIQFTLVLSESIIDKYQWVGIGFKDLPEIECGMADADINNIIIGSDPVDSYASCNSPPIADTLSYGVDNIEDPYYDEYSLVYTWSRPVDSGDELDRVYTKDKKMKLLWAFGKVKKGVQMKHMVPDRGAVEIQLSDDFNLECNDVLDLINQQLLP